MKSGIAKFLSVMMIALLLAGCKAQPEEPLDSDPSDARQKETVSTETESVTIDNTKGAEEKPLTDEPLITEDEAKDIALKDAGLKEDQVSGIRIKQEIDDGIQQYEISFYADNKEYDYDIDAASGNILSKDIDVEKNSQKTGSSDASVSETQAKKIALDKVPGAGDGDIKLHLDRDDGKAVYEGSIVYKKRKYEFEIDANSGDILEWEDESVYD